MYNPYNCRQNSTTQCCPVEINIDDDLDSEGDELENEGENHLVDIHSDRHSLGNMDVKCPNCSALHWMDDRLTNSS